MRKAAVDIGTNSMRLLITEDGEELGRWQRVTGLGRGVDGMGRMSEERIARTIEVLAEYGDRMQDHGVEAARAVATSASRDAENRDDFIDRAEEVLGIRPQVIGSDEEAALAFAGATSDAPGQGPYVVLDVGGGSTEVVWERDGEIRSVSVDIGSVRITDRMLEERPVDFDRLAQAGRHVDELLVVVTPPPEIGTVIGVAGTWTSLAGIHLNLPTHDRERIHHAILDRLAVDRLVERLASLSVEATAQIPALDPARAPVILGGAIVARECMRRLVVSEVVVSERDLLDGVVASL